MDTLTREIKEYLVSEGADLIGIGDLNEIDYIARSGMRYGICIAVAIPKKVIREIENGPTLDYYKSYFHLNDRLDMLVTKGAKFLLEKGFEDSPRQGK